MPRLKNEPTLYLPMVGLLVMKVARPYQAVADWCGGHLRMDGVKFSHIDIVHEGEVHRMTEGSYIAAERDDSGFIVGFSPLNGARAEYFEKMYRKAIPGECI